MLVHSTCSVMASDIMLLTKLFFARAFQSGLYQMCDVQKDRYSSI